ncbi:DUF4123 domain-containing protein [Pseudomonas sp. KFB-139]|uniref:DUF4123 domain-containing protein n=1 Tax=Pseudomonas serbiensis TaxID=3064350 RepID=A0ABT9D1J7_9PSED|nr:DUF4123 domain-containing protein [Pseudomonas sp. KFB-138]MDO7930397.1 DUF4123 domain-containing protein [Pseudomonas sp. KFB-138]
MIDAIPSPFKQSASSGLMCLILDSSFDADLLNHLFQGENQASPNCIPLFINTPYADLQPNGPYIVLCPAKSMSQEFAAALLEQEDAGCVAWLSSSASLDQGIEHWRSLLTVRTDDEPQQMMRFYDPRWLEPLLLSFSEAEQAQFIGPFTALAWRNEIGWRYYANPPQSLTTTVQPTAWLYLSSERQVLIEQGRLKVIATRFAEDYRDALPAEDPVAFVYRQLLAGKEIGYEQIADQERWLRLAIGRGDSFWKRSPDAEVLARSDVALGDKLAQLESL